jgi:predicted secreted protein
MPDPLEDPMALHRSTRFLALAASMIVATTALAAVSSANAATPDKKDITLTVTRLPAQVRLVPGEAVNVELSTNVTTGYSWSTKVVGKKGTVDVADGVYKAPTTSLVGAPGTTTWKVTAKKKGTAVVKFLATPPGGGTPTSNGSLTVIVK